MKTIKDPEYVTQDTFEDINYSYRYTNVKLLFSLLNMADGFVLLERISINIITT